MSEAGRAASAHSASSWSSSVARERSMMAVGLRGQALLCILGAVACIVMLYAPSPVEGIRAFFDNQFIINNGKWYGMYFPGHSALLAIGSWVGAQRWVPTASAVLTAWLSFASARLIFGKRVAILTLVLLVLSPYFVMSSATLLAHSTAALFLLP